MKIRIKSVFLAIPFVGLLTIYGITLVFAKTTENVIENWQQVNTSGFGDINNSSGKPYEFNGHLYASTFNNVTGAKIYQYIGGETWTAVITDGFGNVNNKWILSPEIFSDTLYVSTQNDVSVLKSGAAPMAPTGRRLQRADLVIPPIDISKTLKSSTTKCLLLQ